MILISVKHENEQLAETLLFVLKIIANNSTITLSLNLQTVFKQQSVAVDIIYTKNVAAVPSAVCQTDCRNSKQQNKIFSLFNV
jgi:hypothetical protein